MPAIWTDADGEVQRIYHDESALTDEQLQGSTIVDSIPKPTESEKESSTMYYSDADGFYFEYETYPTRLRLPDGSGEDLVDAVNSGDVSKVVDIIENSPLR